MPKKPTKPRKDYTKIPKETLRKQWQAEEQKKRVQSLAEPGPFDENQDDWTDEELKSDWDVLKATAKAQFPAYLIYDSLNPRQRLVGIAHVLGWSGDKISKASSVPKTTVYRWLERPDIKKFIDEFKFHTGSRPVMDFIDQNQFAAARTIKSLMEDTSVSATTRLDAAKWMIERRHGKPNQPIDHKGTGVRELTQKLMEQERTRTTPPAESEDEDELESIH